MKRNFWKRLSSTETYLASSPIASPNHVRWKTSVRPNYQQLFAQALSALRNGEKSYFDAQQVKLIMKSNSQFEIIQPIDQYFLLYFELVEDEKEGEYLTAAEIFDYLKKQIGSSLKVNSLMGFGRKLANMSELKHKRFADGMKYLVKKKWNNENSMRH